MTQLWWVIAIGGLATLLIRGSFLMVAERFEGLPPRVETVLRMIPPAALAALVAPAMLRPGGGSIDLLNPVLAGGVVALALALWRRNVLLALAGGFAVTTLVGLFVG